MDIHFSAVTERDVDLLLVEELASSPAFLEWFLDEVGVPGSATLEGVAHSVSDSSGESDVELTVRQGEKKMIVLIEDKIDAPLQPRQAERYLLRARSYVSRGRCHSARTVLVAPRDYVKGDPPDLHGFEGFLSYEDVKKWFERNTDDASRQLYKLELLRTAIVRGTRGYIVVPDLRVTEFVRLYVELARSLAPELHVEEAKGRPKRATWIRFKPSGMPKNATLYHKVAAGHVDLQFHGGASRMGQLNERYGGRLQAGMILEPAGKSAVVRIHVPPADMSGLFEDSEAKVREGLWAARLLALWVRGMG